ncbi:MULTISPECIES: amidohydrolase [unclassified Cupriavidus]|uniref:amidohydrolase n=1 Tax=unclassified Cupriavidus TaxID=2640874 RepID=UPI001BFFE20D|nr:MULTISPECIES: amidohydrolase [unclassified Cupriavidus]MCA3182752.1 amidohydrolase [Cupriavidus sp.]MCA3192393.1 amidohydrolase [Cupriavidus sp.]MCA3196168.1 amidohydrolase [Cupriavidus sp.]MCA3203701.1 amidohydrolase [Cupriavidus sp.]MCA3234565.1 amidohydrolase [Cupriavidus sp.]
MKKSIRTSLLALAAMAALHAHAAPTLVESVQGYTLQNDKLTQFTGLVFDQGKVLATGDAAGLRARYPDARRIDGQGKTLLPGLIDAHGHVFRLGFKTTEISLSGTKDLQEAQGIIRAYGQKNTQRKWLLGYGWNQVNWKLGRFPTAAELDAAVSDRPARLVRVDGHAAWLNTKALQAAGITRDTKDPAGGRIERDANGNPTGVLVDKAMALVNDVIPPYTDDDRRAALSAAIAHMNALGLTAVGDAGVTVTDDRIYREFADQGKLTTRIYAMIRDTGDDFKALSAKGPVIGYGNDRYYLRAVKLYGDGALGSRGAALIDPYTDDHAHSGLLFMSDAAMQAAVKTAIKAGYQVNVHAIGDKTNHQVLDAMEVAYKEVGGRELRNRIEHAQVVSMPDIPRFKKLDLIASMQPTHATSDMNMAEDRIGKERIKGAYAWQTFLKQGTVIAGGSDFPVESANPFYGLHAAVTRTDHEGRPIKGWHPEEAMTLPQAFRAFTLDAAYAEHQEKTLGSLEAGKWADFVVVDRDLFKVPAGDIWKIQVLETWVAGERVYAKGDQSAQR